jgi:hypothetical protein
MVESPPLIYSLDDPEVVMLSTKAQWFSIKISGRSRTLNIIKNVLIAPIAIVNVIPLLIFLVFVSVVFISTALFFIKVFEKRRCRNIAPFV